MILVLGISIAGMAAVLSWGLPAIEEMRSNVELRTSLKQFQALDAEVKALAAGQASKTTPKWQPSLQAGYVQIMSDVDRWVITTDILAGYNMTLFGLDNTTSNSFVLHNHGSAAIAKLNVTATKLVGSEETALAVSTSSGSSTQMDPNTASLAAGAEVTLYVWDPSGPAVLFDGVVLRFTITEENGGTSTKSKAWMIDTGSVEYTSETGYATKQVIENNGMIIVGDPTDLYSATEPLIPEPRTFTNGATTTRSLFVRIVQMNGTGSFSGEQIVDVLLNLYGTFTLADESDVEGVRITVYGDRQEAWYRYFTDPYTDYRFNKVTDTGASGTRSLTSLYHNEATVPFQFKMLHSVITVVVP